MSMVYGYQGSNSVSLLNLTAGICAAYSWNPSSIEPFIKIDLGPSLLSAPTTIIDHGSVTQQEAFGLGDWGRIIYEDTNYPFGELRPVSNTTWTVVHAWVGSGTVFERGDTYYRLVAPYIVSGTLVVSGNAETHWVPNIESTGLFGIQSLTDEAFTRKTSGSGILFKFGSVSSTTSRAYSSGGLFKLSSNTLVSFQPNWIGDGSLALYNTPVEITRAFGYNGSGRLSTVDTKVERRTYSYNLSSIVYFDYLDFGTIPLQTIENIQTNQTLSGSSTGSTLAIDVGVTASVAPTYQVSLPNGTPDNQIEYIPISLGRSAGEDWGFININQTLYPMGLARLKSETKISFAPNWIGSGDLYVSGIGVGKTNPIWSGSGVIKISGFTIPNFSLSHYGSGNLFHIGGGDSAKTNTYVGSGILFNFVSSEEKISRDYEATGKLGILQSDTLINFVPNWTSYVSIEISGEVSNIKRLFSQDELVNLFVLSGQGYHERRTYDYNDSSIVFFEYEDFGFIAGVGSVFNVNTSQSLSGTSGDSIVQIDEGVTASVDLQYQISLIENSVPDLFFDYGSIAEGYSGNIDWGFVSQTITNYPFGGFRYHSATLTNFSLGNLGSGDINIFGEGKARVNPQWFAYIEIQTNGISDNSITKTFIGSGKLFEFVSSDASRSYSYNGQGRLFNIDGSAESVSFSPEEQQILFRLSGTARESFVPNWNAFVDVEISGFADPILRTFGYQTTGSLFALNSLVERRVYSYNDSSVNYYNYRDYESLPAGGQITDILVDQQVFGFAPTSIIRIGSSGSDVVATIPDGFTYTIDPTIGSITEETVDCGYITSINNERTIREDYGFTSYSSSLRSKITEYPFGSIGNFAGSFAFTPFSIANNVGGEIFISGEISVRVTPKWFAEGTLFSFGGTAESVGFNPPDITTDLKFVGSATEIVTRSELSQSGIISITGAVNISVLTDILRDVHLEIYGSATEAFTPNWNGSGTLFNIGQSSEAKTVRIPAFQADLVLVGSAQIRSTKSEEFTAFVEVFGSSIERQSDAYAGYSISKVFNEATIPLRTRAFATDGRLYAFSGAAESITVNPQEETALFSFTGTKQERKTVSPKGFGSFHISGSTAPEILTFAEQPFVQVSLFGQANVVNLDVYLVEGTLFTIGQSSESITVKIPAFQADIEIKGASTRSRTFGGNIGFRHLYLSGTSGVQILTFAEQPTVFVDVTGQAGVLRSYAYAGDIFIGHFGRSAESISVKLPAFTSDITFRPEKASLSATYREISKGGTIDISGEIQEPILTFAEQPTVFVDVTGVAATPRSRSHVGNIFIGHFGGSAESVTFKLPEFQSDIVFRPTAATIKSTANWVGSGFIQISGTPSQIIFVPNYSGSGTIRAVSLTSFKLAKTYAGFGQIFSIGGSAESVTFNPEERQALFSFTGTKVEKVTFNPPEEGVLLQTSGKVFERFTPNNVGSGVITIDITTRYAQIIRYTGDGEIFAISGAAESITINPDEFTALFSFTGISTNRIGKAYIGTGSIFSFAGAAESIAIQTKADGLFEISGISSEKVSFRESGFGVLFNFVTTEQRRTFSWTSRDIEINLSGVATEKQTDAYIGFGSLFSIDGAGIAIAFSPESIVDIHVFGSARTPRARNFFGSGNLLTFESATESRTIAYENVAIFDFLGVARQRVSRNIIADISIAIEGSANEAFIRDTYRGSVSTEISGESIERITSRVVSDVSTRIFGADVVPIIIKSFNVTGQTVLFGDVEIVRGFVYDGYVPIEIHINTKIIAPYQAFRSEGGVITTIGIARTKRVQVSPSRSYGWII